VKLTISQNCAKVGPIRARFCDYKAATDFSYTIISSLGVETILETTDQTKLQQQRK